jgi:hypothetical protein
MAETREQVIDRFFETNYQQFGSYYPKVGAVIVEKAEKYDLRVRTVAAFVEKESGGRRIFGCDAGSIFCNQFVTREALDRLIRWVGNGGASNGVAWMQLTYFPLIMRAEQRGGANNAGPNIDVGCEELKRLFLIYDDGSRLGWLRAAASYNGGQGNFTEVTMRYARDVEAKALAWGRRLAALT